MAAVCMLCSPFYCIAGINVAIINSRNVFGKRKNSQTRKQFLINHRKQLFHGSIEDSQSTRLINPMSATSLLAKRENQNVYRYLCINK